MIRRVTYLGAYALLAALGEALAARPAVLWVRSQGIFAPALAWTVPFGGLLLACAILVAVLTMAFASRAVTQRRPSLPLNAALLLASGICMAVRFAAGNPVRPPHPAPSLLEGLRAAADELERGYAGSYAADAAQFVSALAQVRPPPFRHLGRTIPLHARILSSAGGPQLQPLADDPPGTIYVAIAQDRRSAWLTALDLEAVLTLPKGKPAVVVAREGTHSLPGRDTALPEYPR